MERTKINELVVASNLKNKLKAESLKYPSLILNERQICDLELLLNGSFFPLKGFLNKRDYDSVIETMHLQDGSLWPIPIALDVSKEFLKKIKSMDKITLKDKEGFPLAILTISDIWEYDRNKEAVLVYKTDNIKHPAVNYIFNKQEKFYIGGDIVGIQYPVHYDFLSIRHTPNQVRELFNQKGWEKIVAFQTRNPLHRAHMEMVTNTYKNLNSNLLIHPVVGMTKPGDVDHFTRVRCYKFVMKKFKKNKAILSLLPLAMRMGGPREAVLHALIRKNYGCTHLIVGRDHAGPGTDENGNFFYEPYEAQDLIKKYKDKVGIDIVPFKLMVYVPSIDKYKSIDKIEDGLETNSISGTQLRTFLDKGKKIPDWFTYKEIANELQKSRLPLHKRGLTVFFTGLSGSGKSTLANGLLIKFLEDGNRAVTLLDGDIVRTHLSSELGFSKEHRSLNVQRIGYVASEITKNGGIAICAPIAPYEKDRKLNRDLISRYGGYIEIFVDTPIEKCEERDSKGLYKLARKGIIKEFTGISDPYEKPIKPDLTLNSSKISPAELVEIIFSKIKNDGYIK